MKKVPFFKLLIVPAVLGLIFFLSFCKKDTETVTVNHNDTITINKTIHDTIRINDTLRIYVTDSTTGKSIIGAATYTNNSGANVPAQGAIVVLYYGSVANPNYVVATTFSDASGNYNFKFLAKGDYFVYSKYNTVNQNARLISDGFNFVTNPGYPVTLGTTDFTQNLALVNMAPAGAAQISMDTTPTSLNNFRKVTFETHSKLGFSFANYSDLTTLQGGFNVFQMDNFVFDEANPDNTKFSGYTVFSSISTFEPTRDALGISGTGTNNLTKSGTYFATGCVHATLDNYIDSAKYYNNPANSPNAVLPETDTARFVSNSVVRYGDGYIAHGTLTAFYKHIAKGPMTGVADGGYNYASDTAGFFAAAGYAYNGPLTDGMISLPVDLYFVYSKEKVVTVTGGVSSFVWWFVFEGQFSFRPQTQFYITSGHFADGPITVNAHVEFQGTKNVVY